MFCDCFAGRGVRSILATGAEDLFTTVDDSDGDAVYSADSVRGNIYVSNILVSPEERGVILLQFHRPCIANYTC